MTDRTATFSSVPHPRESGGHYPMAVSGCSYHAKSAKCTSPLMAKHAFANTERLRLRFRSMRRAPAFARSTPSAHVRMSMVLLWDDSRSTGEGARRRYFGVEEEERTTACKACRGHARCGRRGRLLQVVCGAGWGACAAARLCVGMARVSRGEKRAPRACAGCGPPVPPRPPRGETRCVCVCVFVRHTARRRLWGVGAACEEAAGKRRASPVRRYTAGGGPPPAQRRMCVRVRSPG